MFCDNQNVATFLRIWKRTFCFSKRRIMLLLKLLIPVSDRDICNEEPLNVITQQDLFVSLWQYHGIQYSRPNQLINSIFLDGAWNWSSKYFNYSPGETCNLGHQWVFKSTICVTDKNWSPIQRFSIKLTIDSQIRKIPLLKSFKTWVTESNIFPHPIPYPPPREWGVVWRRVEQDSPRILGKTRIWPSLFLPHRGLIETLLTHVCNRH